MSDEASPRPWRVELSIGDWASCVADAKGDHVASCYGNQWCAEGNARLIVNAVNMVSAINDELLVLMAKNLEAPDKEECLLRAALLAKTAALNEVRDERNRLREEVRTANESIALLESEHDELCDAVRSLLCRASFLNGFYLGRHASGHTKEELEEAENEFGKTKALIDEIDKLVNHNPERNPKQ